MSLAKFLFKQIDYWGYIPQNTYHDKNAKKILKNQIYSEKKAKNCILDIYCQKNDENVIQPVFINLHGGGFIAGDKKYRKSFCKYCTKFGLKVLNVNYSLAPDSTITEILDELADLFKWIKTNSTRFKLDTDKIILCGDSAGAYLAAWLCCLAKTNMTQNSINLPKIDTKIVGAVLFSGIYYPTESLEKDMILGINHSLWEYLCGDKFVDINTCKEHKYFNLLDVGKFVDKDFPPTFISHSETDIFCGDNGKKLAAKLQECGVPYREVCSKNNMHDWQENMFTKSAKLTLAQFDKFMYDLLDGNVTNENNSTTTISHGKIIEIS